MHSNFFSPKKTPKTLERETGRRAINVSSTEHNNMTVITVYGHQNIRAKSKSMLLKSRVQEPDGYPGQDSRPLCLLLGRVGEVVNDPRHKPGD